MLLKFILSLFITLNVYASDQYTIVKENDTYYIKNKMSKISITYNGEPKIIKQYKKKELYFVEYYSGEYGTSDIVRVNNLIILKENDKIIDAPFKYFNKIEQPKWEVDHIKKIIKITDSLGSDQSVKFK